jgi:hypothetical protein
MSLFSILLVNIITIIKIYYFIKNFILIVINIFVIILNFRANNYSHNFLDPTMYGPRQQKQ